MQCEVGFLHKVVCKVQGWLTKMQRFVRQIFIFYVCNREIPVCACECMSHNAHVPGGGTCFIFALPDEIFHVRLLCPLSCNL